MAQKQEQPLPLAGDTKKKLSGRKCKELDGQTAAMLGFQTVCESRPNPRVQAPAVLLRGLSSHTTTH